jgi:hypothetical protein
MRTTPLALALLAGLTSAGTALAWPSGKSPWVFDLPQGGQGCTELPESLHPIRYDVNFDADLRPVIDASFAMGGCGTCHVAGSSGGMNLSTVNALASLIGTAETGTPTNSDPSLLRVRPFVPTDSVIFLKVNCATPPFGGQMPPGGGAATQFQANLHDWIASGAIMSGQSGGDRTFVGSFESITRPAPAPQPASR